MEDIDSANIAAILESQFQDLPDLLQDRDGDGSDQTDAEVAMHIYLQEIRRAAIEAHDHLTAVTLGNNSCENISEDNDEDNGDGVSDDEDEDNGDGVRGDEDEDNDEDHDMDEDDDLDQSNSSTPENHDGLQTENNDLGAACLACEDALSPNEQLHAPCGDTYCRECITRLFKSAMKDDSLFPPKCCGEHIPFNLVKHFFSPGSSALFDDREIELSTVDRTYCADPSCSAFIKAGYIKDGKAKCPICSLRTCAICKAVAHKYDCPEDPAAKTLMALAKKEGLKQCHACKFMIELTTGCNHMECRCGAQLCYECGAPWKNCTCPLFHEDRLLGRAPENPCDHNHIRWTRIREPDMECEDCGEVQVELIYECPQCEMRVCARCRWDRRDE